MATIVGLIRSDALDAELAAVLWLLVEGRVPVHVAASDLEDARPIADALAPMAADREAVSVGIGRAVEEVLRQPVPLRPAAGVILVVRESRVVAAHLQRPPLRDAGGHVRPQGPAVLAARDATTGRLEHFAWGVTPDLAAAAGRRAGDFEIEVGRRQAFLEALVRTADDDPGAVSAALSGWRAPGPQH